MNEGELYITGIHALAYWLSPRAARLDTAAPTSTNAMAFRNGTITLPPAVAMPDDHVPKISHEDAIKLRKFFGPGLPLHACAPAEKRRWSFDMICRSLPPNIPADCFIRLSERLLVARPELALLHAAPEMTFIDTAVVTSLLCSLFVVDPCAPGGLTPRRKLLTPHSLTAFFGNSEGVHQTKKLLRAASCCRENSASPAEVNIGLRLALPQKLQGYGFSSLEHNASFPLPNGRIRYPDFLWAKQGVGAEYQSDAEHNDPERHRADQFRLNELSDAGLTMFQLTSEHLMSTAKMDIAAKQIAKALGRHAPSTDTRGREILRCELDDALSHYGELWK